MPVERYFLRESLHPHETKTLKGTEFHHLAHVMRTRKGDEIELVNGQGVLAQAIVQEIRKDQAHLLVQSATQEKPGTKQVILAQAMPKLNRLDYILEKGTELGVDAFWLFPGQLSVKKEFQGNQLERLQAILISAMKQCGRLYLPTLEIKPALDQWQNVEGTLFFGDVEEKAPLFAHAFEEKSLSFPIIFCTGPESGLTAAEINHLKALGAQGVKLHQSILRTDTASIAALALIQHWLLAM